MKLVYLFTKIKNKQKTRIHPSITEKKESLSCDICGEKSNKVKTKMSWLDSNYYNICNNKNCEEIANNEMKGKSNVESI